MTRHPLAGRTVRLNDKAADPARNVVVPGVIFKVEDYWQNVAGSSWMTVDGNPATLRYAYRAGFTGLQADNEVVYGHHIDGVGDLVHISELGEVQS